MQSIPCSGGSFKCNLSATAPSQCREDVEMVVYSTGTSDVVVQNLAI